MTPEEIERRLADGSLSLYQAVELCLGALENKALLCRWLHAMNEYRIHGRDFAEAVGLAITTKQRNKRNQQNRNWRIRKLVDASQLPKGDPSYFHNTAFHEVGKHLSLAPKTVFDLYYRRGKSRYK